MNKKEMYYKDIQLFSKMIIISSIQKNKKIS